MKTFFARNIVFAVATLVLFLFPSPSHGLQQGTLLSQEPAIHEIYQEAKLDHEGLLSMCVAMTKEELVEIIENKDELLKLTKDMVSEIEVHAKNATLVDIVTQNDEYLCIRYQIPKALEAHIPPLKIRPALF